MFRKLGLITAALVLLMLGPQSAVAQRNEVAVLLGGYVPIGNTLDVSPAVALQGAFAHRIASVPLAAVYLELPVTVGFNVSASGASGGIFSAANYSALFITPGFKLKIAPDFFVSPFFVLGAGYARYHTDNAFLTTLHGGDTSNKAVYDFGGGMDIKVIPHVSVRGEVRDYRSASPDILSLLGIGGHNIVGAGGLVLQF
ncbi:MAG: outer membrane protein [Terriglobales bacterium]